jgi:hypothetical protein
MEGQLLKVHSTQEALRTFSDGIKFSRTPKVKNRPCVSLKGDTRLRKENLNVYSKRHSQDDHFVRFTTKVLEYARSKAGIYIEPGDIWVTLY